MIPIVVENYLDRLITSNPNKSLFNLIGILNKQLNMYSVTAIGMWLAKYNNVDLAIYYLSRRAVKMNAKGTQM